MRTTWTFTVVALGVLAGCVDAKDTGEDSEGSDGSGEPTRSIDAGAWLRSDYSASCCPK